MQIFLVKPFSKFKFAFYFQIYYLGPSLTATLHRDFQLPCHLEEDPNEYETFGQPGLVWFECGWQTNFGA